MPRRQRIDRAYLQVGSVFLALAVLWVALSLSTPYFLTTQNVLNILLQSAVVGILAAGFTIVLIGGEIDLSIASVQALAGTIAAVLIIQEGLSISVAIPLVILVGVAAGLVNGYFTVFARIPSFIVTLAMLGIAQGIAFVLTSGRTIGGFPDAYHVLGRGDIAGVPIPVICFIGVYVVLHLLLTQTRYGVELYAVGGARRAADLVGLRTGRIVVTSFVISGLLAAFAGLVLSSRLNAGHGGFGATELLDAVAAVVIGGTSLYGGAGTVIGTFGGVLIISTIRNGLILLGVDPFWQQVVVGVIILLAVMVDQMIKGHLRPRDLVGRSRRTR